MKLKFFVQKSASNETVLIQLIENVLKWYVFH